jgi:ABC-type sugar transport system ATPase subunit
VQTGTPDELWTQPADSWVATFLGMRNVVADRGSYRVIRPEGIRITAGSGATVLSAERRGPIVWLRVRLDQGLDLDAAVASSSHPGPGERVAVEIDPAGVTELPWHDEGA